MAKLYFRYGAMGASKTANALMVKYNYEERGQNVLLLKPDIDNRDGESIIRSRIGLFSETRLIKRSENISNLVFDYIKQKTLLHCIIIDEAQFLTKQHVYELTEFVDNMGIPVICYGLRADFKGDLFEGSQWLLALADIIEEVKTICWCGRKAIMNARVVDGRVVKEGEQIQLGGNESYVSLCRHHWAKGELAH